MPPSHPSTLTEDPAVRYCEACGRPASVDTRFCAACGKAVLRPEQEVLRRGKTKEQELFDIRPLAIQTFTEFALALLTLGLAWLVLWVRRIQIRYYITDQRIELVEGVFNLRRMTVELFRVQDYEVQEPLFLRLRGGGNLLIRSLDPEEGEITLTGIAGVHEVFETVRRATLEQRESHRVRLLEGI